MKISRIFIPSVYVNCYLLIDEPSGALAAIDPGDDISKDLLRFCTDNGWELRAIFLTHGHYDHVGGVPALRRAFPNVPVYLHPADADNKDVLLTGATLFAGSCGRTDFPGGDYGEIMASLKRLGELEENYNILPGHEGPSTLSREKGSNPYLREAMGL